MRSNPAVKTGDTILGQCAFGVLRAHNALRRAFVPRFRPGAEVGEEARTILVGKLCCLGDAVLAVPAIRALKTRWPQAHLIVLCTPRSSAAFADLPFVDEVVSLPVTGLGGLGEFLSNGSNVLRELRRLRKRRPDIAVDLDLYFKLTPVMGYVTGAPVRAGFDTAGYNRAGLFSHAVPREPDKWETECFLDVVGAIGAETDDRTLELPIPPEANAAADQILRAHRIEPGDRYVVVCPGSSKNWPTKQWPMNRFAEVVDWLAQGRGLKSIVIGAQFESRLCQEVVDRATADAVNLAGETSVVEMASILQRAEALVTNDTGPLHLGCAVGATVVAIFGPTNEKKWGPRGPRDITIVNEDCDCRPCYYLSHMPNCDHRDCLIGIPTQRVIDALGSILPAD